MPLEEPSWWYGAGADDVRVRALKPVSAAYAWAGMRRFKNATPYKSALPVICVGNFTAGGTGKTPLSLLMARLLTERGHSPAFLTRGYSGRNAGPVWVDKANNSSHDVGDEPLLLAKVAPTLVARNRPNGARAIEAGGTATHIVMDDGLQNPDLQKTFSIAVVDGHRGLGNGEVIPAGPLRLPVGFQFDLADMIVVNGGGPDAPVFQYLRNAFPGPVLSASIEPRLSGGSESLEGARVAAFAGIGNPARFITSLRAMGAEVVAEKFFKDHHAFSDADARELMQLADESHALLVTTEKDNVRLNASSGALAELARRVVTLPIAMVFEAGDLKRLQDLILPPAPEQNS